MSVKMLEGKFNPATQNVFIRGDFNGWSTTDQMTDANADSIYDVNITNLTVGSTVNFKFYFDNPDTWESDPNRQYAVPSGGGTYTDYFDRDSVVTIPVGKASVTFKCDMRVKMKELQFNPSTQNLFVRGSFNGWASTDRLSDANSDSVYEKTIDSLEIGSTVYFKYFFDNPDTWENDPNRSYIVPSADGEFRDYFDRDSVVTITGNGNILFQVNMSVMTEIGIYDPNIDKLQVRASFNGWSGNDTARSHLNQDFLDPNIWFLDVPFSNTGIGELQYYKYYVVLQNPGIWTDGWERPCSRGGGNREVPFLAQSNQEAPYAYYDDIDPEWVIDTSKHLQAIFNVNMKPAMDAGLQAIPFNPALDTVYWIGEQPSFVRTQGWTDGDQMRVLQLTDPDGDSIYTGTMSIQTPSFNSFVYRYAFVSGTDASWYHEPAGFGSFAYRVRFIGQDTARSFPVNPWNMPVDTWTNADVKKDQETDPYTSYLFVREDNNLVPQAYQLFQNYPNPFNPVTTIRFTVSNQTFVTLKVYNMLGQEITTLVNEELTPGTYRANFSGTSLASGMYFYQLNTSKYIETKKMLLLK
ncbi:MAG: T9SS type A sorting domain-containing protein [Ignavibacteriales bacterium]|nr:T9SS type A sorting domain-containing protein [Ignavibacteriales bacterium]